MINLTKFSCIFIVASMSLCLSSYGEDWPKSDQLADAVMDIIEEVNSNRKSQGKAIIPVTHAQYKAKFENCSHKWKEKNKISGELEYKYQFGETVLTFLWADYGKDGGKKVIYKIDPNKLGL